MLRRLKMKVACRHYLPKLGRKVIEGYGISKTENQNVIFFYLNLFQSLTMNNVAKGQYTIFYIEWHLVYKSVNLSVLISVCNNE